MKILTETENSWFQPKCIMCEDDSFPLIETQLGVICFRCAETTINRHIEAVMYVKKTFGNIVKK